MPRRLLVVTTVDLPGELVRARVRAHAGDGAEVMVVAPASDLSPLQWLTGEEDEAREQAAARADRVASSVPGRVVEAGAGDTDPVQAIEDALRRFPADEVLVLTRPDEVATWLETEAGRAAQERFRVPVTRMTVED